MGPRARVITALHNHTNARVRRLMLPCARRWCCGAMMTCCLQRVCTPSWPSWGFTAATLPQHPRWVPPRRICCSLLLLLTDSKVGLQSATYERTSVCLACPMVYYPSTKDHPACLIYLCALQAFVKLESLPSIPSERRQAFAELALAVFARRPPADPRSLAEARVSGGGSSRHHHGGLLDDLDSERDQASNTRTRHNR